ncbi:hypothetical protein WJX77_011337 [Trebouxia sp. C0004]
MKPQLPYLIMRSTCEEPRWYGARLKRNIDDDDLGFMVWADGAWGQACGLVGASFGPDAAQCLGSRLTGPSQQCVYVLEDGRDGNISDTPYGDIVKKVWVPAPGGGMQQRNMPVRQSLGMHDDRQKLLAALPAYFEYNKSHEAQIVAKILEQSAGSTPGEKFDSFIHTIGDLLSGQENE